MKHKVVKPNAKAWHTSVLLQLKSACFHSKASKAVNKISLKNTIPYLWVTSGIRSQSNSQHLKNKYISRIHTTETVNEQVQISFFELDQLVNGSTVI